MATKSPTAQVESWCLEHGWSDPFWEGDCFWAFPPGAVMPLPVPDDFYRSRLPLPDEGDLQRSLSAQTFSSSALRKWRQQRFLNEFTWIIFTLGVVLLAISDPQYPGSLLGLPPVAQGLKYSQFLVLEVLLYQAFLWVRAARRGESNSLGKLVFTMVLMMLLGIFKGFG